VAAVTTRRHFHFTAVTELRYKKCWQLGNCQLPGPICVYTKSAEEFELNVRSDMHSSFALALSMSENRIFRPNDMRKIEDREHGQVRTPWRSCSQKDAT
jgi:hypothetical protein